MQGAGGVGGLLAEVQDSVPYFAAFDANGNVTEYLSTDGTVAAHYEYSPFGEIVVQSGDLAASFTYCFSTKPWCPVTGLSEYEKRKYRPGLGRWLSRDPIGEEGGVALTMFAINSPIDELDPNGLYTPEFKGKWSEEQKSIVLEAFKQLRAQLPALIASMQEAIERANLCASACGDVRIGVLQHGISRLINCDARIETALDTNERSTNGEQLNCF